MTTHKQVSFGNEINRTSDILVLSTIHGRQRRSERDLTKRDLQAAVKYGKKERGYADRHGRPRWMFTFADIVYITDSTCTVEITSYPLPIHVAAAPITREMCKIHAAALLAVEIPRTWTSHTVLVVDQSGSMKKPDMADCSNRSDAVWVSLALDWTSKQIEGGAKGSDVVSLLLMNDEATLVFEDQPIDWLLFNRLLELRKTSRPRSHGNYIPALDSAEELLLSNTSGRCGLLLLFLSDGKPSDRVHGGSQSVLEKHISMTSERIGVMASQFGRRLTVGTIGLGVNVHEFAVLKTMAQITNG
jgi:hypothetical protein